MASSTSFRASQIPVDAEGSISTAVADCEANFKKSVEAMHSYEDDIYAGALEDLQSKFLSWASYLGVFADTQVCLDRRLERHSQYRELVLYVLDTLNMNLLRMITAIGVDTYDSDDSSDDEPERQDVELRGIQSSVNELNRLAMYIRQSSISSLDARVKAFRSKKPGEIWRFQTAADIALKTLYPLTSESLRQHLSSSMLDRYAKLLYWKVHDRKLQTDRRRRPKPAEFHVSVPTEQIRAATPGEASVTTSENYPKPSSSGERRRGLELRAVSGVSSHLSGTIPSNIGSRLQLPPAESESPARKRANASTLFETGGDFPRPPHFGIGEDLRPCPFCRKLLKRIDCIDEKWWRHHVNEDLTPFLCISNTCSQFPQSSSRTEWVDHMSIDHEAFWQQYHTTELERSKYLCPICCMALQDIHDRKPADRSLRSRSAANLRQKRQRTLRTVRFDVPSGDSNLTESNVAEPTFGLDAPPPPQVSMSKPRERMMMDHIAGHLQFLALLVPRLSVENLTSGDGNKEYFDSDDDSISNFNGRRSTLDDSLEDLTSSTFDDDGAENWNKDPVPEDENDLQPEINEVVSEQHMYTATTPEHFENLWDFLTIPNTRDGEVFESHPTDLGERYRSSVIDGLRRDLADARINTGDQNEFVPISSLRRLITEPRIDAWLSNCKNIITTRSQELTRFILEEAIRMFAVLVWINRIESIGAFHDWGLTDEILPITKGSNDSYTVSGVEAHYNREKLQNIIFTTPWTSASRNDMLDAQWRFSAPVFHEGRLQYSVLDHCPLPFWDISEKNAEVFSQVRTGVMHKSHFKLGNSEESLENVPVIIKICHNFRNFPQSDFDSAVRTEVDALEKIKSLRQQHLVRAIAYFVRMGSHYFVFPVGLQGTLSTFYFNENFGPRPSSVTYMKWVFTQLLGLAGAIEKLHSHPTMIQHKGIRPEHIVCFRSDNNEDMPLLAISGHGISGFSDLVVRATERAGETVARARVLMYDPPERELSSSRSSSRRWDIWSIGCVYLEFLIWVLYGRSALIRLRSDLFADEQGGKFYEIVQNPRVTYSDLQVVIARNVRMWMEQIERDTRCAVGTAVQSLIGYIRNRMLIVNPPEGNFVNPSGPRRAAATELRRFLESLLTDLQEC